MTEGKSCFICIPSIKNDEKTVSRLSAIFSNLYFAEERPSGDELKKATKKYEVIICGASENLGAEIASNSEKLEMVGTLSTGTDHIDIESFQKEEIEVISLDSTNSLSVAEHSFGMILALEKRIVEGNKSVKNGEYRDGVEEYPRELRNRSLGVIGAGKTGSKVAKIGKSFGMEVSIWTYNPDNHRDHAMDFDILENLKELIENTDIVSIHLPLSERSENLIQGSMLEGVESGNKTLINTSRAEIVSENVLKMIGNDGVFSRAALDVHRQTSEAVDNSNIIHTPHLAGVTQESIRRGRDYLCSEIEKRID